MGRDAQTGQPRRPGRGCLRFITRCSLLAFKVFKVLTDNASLHSYFFWAGIIYFAAGIFVFLGEVAVHEFLCTLPAQTPNGQGLGCDNCYDELAMCRKESLCYKYATNLTIQITEALEGTLQFQHMTDATEDYTCISSVGSVIATNPAQWFAQFPGSSFEEMEESFKRVSTACINWNCEIAKNSLLHPDLSNISGYCTDVYGVKVFSPSTSCPCDVTVPNEELAMKIYLICAETKGIDEVKYRRYRDDLKRKSECFQYAMNQAEVELPTYNPLNQFSFDVFASSTLRTAVELAAESPFDILILFRDWEDKGTEREMQNMAIAIDFVCLAAHHTLVGDACDSLAESIFVGRSRQEFCHYCARVEVLLGIRCNGVQTTSTTTAGPVSARRAAAVEKSAGAPSNASYDNYAAAGGACTDTKEEVDATKFLAAESPYAEGGREAWSAMARRTQDLTADNDDYPEYTTTAWTKCTCYQQCMPGVKHRSVRCGAEKCMEPRPTETEACNCRHCTDCNTKANLLILAISFWVQGGLALLLALCFWMVLHLTEDDVCANIAWWKLGIGAVCKLLPLAVRVLVYVNLVQIMLLLFQAWMPTDWMANCRKSSALRMITLVTTACWLVQLGLGIYKKRSQSAPPWLFVPAGRGVMKLFCAPFRAIGP